MKNNFLGLVLSVVYLGALVLISTFCYKKKKLSLDESRKLAHIGACNWWLIAWLFFDNVVMAASVPAVFSVVALLDYFKGMIPVLTNRTKKERSLGAFWYGLAVFVLTIILFQNTYYMFIGAIAILILGYGDGLGGLIGKYFGKHELSVYGKTAEGSLSVLITSFVIAYAILQAVVPSNDALYFSLVIAVCAMQLELFSPFDADNFLLPMGVAGITYLLITYEYASVFGIAFAVTALVIFLTLVTKKLTGPGAAVAFALGVSIYCLAGPFMFWALIMFFASTALIESYHLNKDKEARESAQVIANGLPCLLFCIMYYFTKNEISLIAAFVSIAGACADSWGSGLGYYSKEKVKSIFTWKELPKGSSGGVTKLGTLGSFLGALLIAFFSLFVPGDNLLIRFLIILGFGFFTSILDSIFGVFLQVKYYDPKKGVFLEKRPKSMKGIEKVSGYEIVTNGMVNYLTIMISALLSALAAYMIF